MPDIYNRSGNQFAGSIAADAARVVFSGVGDLLGTGTAAGGVGLLTQSLQISYMQQVSRIYEIGTPYTYLVAGRAQGQLGMGRVVGPRKISQAFYRKFGDVCNAATNNINLEAAAGCAPDGNAAAELAFQLKTVVLTSIALSIAAQDMVINEQVGAMFISLEI